MEVKAIWSPLLAYTPGPQSMDIQLSEGQTIKGVHYAGHIHNAEDELVPCTWLRVTVDGLVLLEVPVKDEKFTMAHETRDGSKVRLNRLSNPFVAHAAIAQAAIN